jgi:hypothetical protein
LSDLKLNWHNPQMGFLQAIALALATAIRRPDIKELIQ